jgi:hypothetical protein
MFEERDVDAIKGVGWGLKTLGRYYPELVSGWLKKQVARPHKALMERKARMYLGKRGGWGVEGGAQRETWSENIESRFMQKGEEMGVEAVVNGYNNG